MSEPVASVGDVLGAAGEPMAVLWAGRTYRLGPPTVATLARLEELVLETAEAEIAAQPARRRKRMEDRLEDHIMSRAYRVGGELYQRVMEGPDGGTLFVAALVREHHPGFAPADAKRMAAEEPGRVRRALAAVTPTFLRLVGEQQGATPDQIARNVAQALDSLASSPDSPG